MYIPYCAIIEGDFKTLIVDKRCSSKFLVDGEIVKIPESGVVVFPKDTTITVCKFLHFVKHNIDMAINRSVLYHNATMARYGIGQAIEVDEKEKILASLEVKEKI